MFSQFKFPKEESFQRAFSSFSLTEKVVFWILVFLFSVSTFLLLYKVSASFSFEVPTEGGKIKEGVVGSARFINPLLSISEADKDLTSLIYSGLLKATPEGNLVPDLVENYSISEDGLVYDFKLKENLKFHDGSKVTTDDIEFTITKAQDPTLKSPRRASWDGVSIEKINEREIRLVLKQPYGPFLSNATLGILPKKLWKNVSADEFAFSDLNINPVGSGPYKVGSVKKNSSGLPSEYSLKSFRNYAVRKPYIPTVNIKFYSNENDLIDALRSGEINSANISSQAAKDLKKNFRVERTLQPRIFAVFFNQNQANIFAEKALRQALDISADKSSIVNEVLKGYGQEISSPIPNTSIKNGFVGDRTEKAKEILTKAGWKLSSTTGIMEKKTKSATLKLSFTISTSEAPELKATAEKLISDWQKIGAEVTLAIYETGDLNQNIIRPRKYDALFFGEIIGRDRDISPFWHSSQRNDPGLNVAMYVNNRADKILEEARAASNIEIRDAKYEMFLKEIEADVPAVFVYSPQFLYVVPEKIKGIKLGTVTTASERFTDIENWYMQTTRVWKIFSTNVTN